MLWTAAFGDQDHSQLENSLECLQGPLHKAVVISKLIVPPFLSGMHTWLYVDIFLGKIQLLLSVQWYYLSVLPQDMFKTFFSRSMSRTIGFKEVFSKIRVMLGRGKKHVSANSSTTAKKWICQFLLLPNEESSLWQTILFLLLWSLPWVMIARIPCIAYFRVDWQHLFVISKAIIGISKDLQLSLRIMAIQFSCFYICYFLFLTASPKSAKTNFSCFV